eukprot:1568552-Rhodomonas_salina.1
MLGGRLEGVVGRVRRWEEEKEAAQDSKAKAVFTRSDRTERETDTHRHTDTQTDRDSCTQTDRQTHTHTHTYTHPRTHAHTHMLTLAM